LGLGLYDNRKTSNGFIILSAYQTANAQHSVVLSLLVLSFPTTDSKGLNAFHGFLCTAVSAFSKDISTASI
jgi:uncharacterized protein YegL